MDQLLSYNPLTGVESYMHSDSDGTFTFHEKQRKHVKEILRHAAEWSNHVDQPYIGNTQRHRVKVAEIPALVVNKLIRNGIFGDSEAMKKWLNTEEGRPWRTDGGKQL